VRAAVVSISILLLTLGVARGADAAQVIDLVPNAPGGAPGAVLTLSLALSFEEPSVGGGVEIAFDMARLEFVSFAFDATLGDDPALQLFCPGVAPGCQAFDGPGLLVAFGAVGGLSGSRAVGALAFRVLAPGPAEVTTGPNDAPAGAFFSAVTGLEQDVTVGSATLANVPEPASALLVAAGLVALTARSRR
jgi:hypothetical protein